MSWRTDSMSYRHIGQYETAHHNDDSEHSLIVASHRHGANGVVVLRSPSGDGVQRHTLTFAAGRPTTFTYHNRLGADYPEETHEPSERLKSLITSHHENKAWMPLLDALAEEYPEHFESAVAEHTRARSESDATQYARSIAAALADVLADEPLRVTRFDADGTRTVTRERLSEIAAKSKPRRDC